MFSPNLDEHEQLNGQEFFTILRLIVHAANGKELSQSLSFIQTTPSELEFAETSRMPATTLINESAIYERQTSMGLPSTLLKLFTIYHLSELPDASPIGQILSLSRQTFGLLGLLVDESPRPLTKTVGVGRNTSEGSRDYSGPVECERAFRQKAIFEWLLMILCGHPGIGKSMFLYILLTDRLSKNLPTIFETSDAIHLFNAEGVVRISKDAPLAVVETLVPSGTGAPVDAHPAFRAPTSFLTKVPSEQQLADFYTNFGPSARTAYHYATKPIDYESELAGLFEVKSPDMLIQELKCMNLQQMDRADRLSHRLFLAVPGGNNREEMTITIPTQRLAQCFYNYDLSHHSHTIRAYLKMAWPTFRAVPPAGYMFEFAAHELLVGGTKLTAYPMKGGETAINITYQPAQKINRNEFLPLDFPPREAMYLGYISRTITPESPQKYYQDSIQSEVILDLFVFDEAENVITVFEMGVGKTIDLNQTQVLEIL
ncbi:hypothetical protein CPB84DRAFT_1743757 [Gymnopilus junonius]|uniref:Uncharacterized protein n=1 Tax=Gymnopilus junonius TaxID=109634 RepID=A0A9P5NYJ0_GYMJU|nr:hypothetical protein CPB84DRAFT_1743757 [Gymnopilus junonius]